MRTAILMSPYFAICWLRPDLAHYPYESQLHILFAVFVVLAIVTDALELASKLKVGGVR